MIIRKGNFSDLAAMRRLFTDTISSVCKNDYNTDQINAWKSGADNDERWLKVMEHQLVMVAEIKGQITGFCTLDHGNYIDLLFVHKDFQHQGIAGKLYTFIEREARHQNQKVLTADVSKTARPFFEKMGFMVITEQTVSVKGTDLINYQMQKELN
ncbi:GNAT family N-acetyltransferase [Chryseobacterium sp. L7]|uniref:GNAT family N-acetyltransferase n=1 Tax=Chryseobacterium endalhagicum TaxID=2797638 RepID=A0ABS1QBP8_9FLAO|nr:GNAT family N-acetyltransferase [Chryseobacterium endalhagicum]MBL1219737.1 GNAT family N-acetyltransferase [Chryseobacterium endalhagicum]